MQSDQATLFNVGYPYDLMEEAPLDKICLNSRAFSQPFTPASKVQIQHLAQFICTENLSPRFPGGCPKHLIFLFNICNVHPYRKR